MFPSSGVLTKDENQCSPLPRDPLKVLVAVDHAAGISGPHRNVVGSLNALAARPDVSLRLVCGTIDRNEPFAAAPGIDIHTGFDPHKPAAFFSNLRILHRAASGIGALYCPTGLKTLLLLQFVRSGKRLVAGPNVTPLPIRKADSPGWAELNLLCDLWLEASWAKYRHTVAYTGDKKVRRVPHALDTQTFSPAHRDPAVWSCYGIPKDSLKVLFVGSDVPRRKGVPELLDAIELLGCRFPGEDLDFVFVGKFSEATLARIGSITRAHRLTFKSGTELARIYASADIAVIPSLWENFPFTVLESMASGLAVVATRIGGIPEQVVHGESGLLVDSVDEHGRFRSNTAELLAQSIAELIHNPELRSVLAFNARTRVQTCFSEELLGARLSTVLRGEEIDQTLDA
jgi:glycosyltransferase involved in cell wall biosynthesis